MKKLILCTLSFVALSLCFTSCNGNNPSGPSDVNPADLISTDWRVDSSHIAGVLDFIPHAVIEVQDDKVVIFNGNDTTNYWVEGDKLYYGESKAEGNVATIKKFDKKTAVLFFEGMQADLFLSIIPKPEGAALAKTAENILGTWKCGYYYYRYSYYVEATNSYAWDGQKHSDPGVVYWTFNADGTFTSLNVVFANIPENAEYATQTGWWEVKDGKFAYGYDTKPAEIEEGYWVNIETLTANAFYFGKTEQSWTGTTQMSYTYFFREK